MKEFNYKEAIEFYLFEFFYDSKATIGENKLLPIDVIKLLASHVDDFDLLGRISQKEIEYAQAEEGKPWWQEESQYTVDYDKEPFWERRDYLLLQKVRELEAGTSLLELDMSSFISILNEYKADFEEYGIYKEVSKYLGCNGQLNLETCLGTF